MVSVTCFRSFFADPLPSFNWWSVSVGREELKWRLLAHYHLMSLQGPHCPPEKLKPLIKGLIQEECYLVDKSRSIASVYPEKTHLKKCWITIIIIIIMNKSQESTVFHGRQKLTSAMKQRPEK